MSSTLWYLQASVSPFAEVSVMPDGGDTQTQQVRAVVLVECWQREMMVLPAMMLTRHHGLRLAAWQGPSTRW